ncbi:MAG: hypothetical protein ABIJ09_15810 [Pseudomonadota bacterium]
MTRHTVRRRFPAPLTFAVALGVLTTSGCPHPASPIPRLAGVEPADLLARLQVAWDKPRQAVGLVLLEYLASDGFFRGEADVAVQRPRNLRIELRSFFGQPAGALVCDGRRYTFVDNTRAISQSGPLDDPALRALLPLGLDATTTVSLLLGGLPALGPGSTSYIKPQRPPHLALRHDDEAGRWLLELDDRAERLLQVEHQDSRGDLRFRARFDGADSRGTVRFSRKGEVEVRGRAGAVSWAWKDVELDGEALPAEAWQLNLPGSSSDDDQSED